MKFLKTGNFISFSNSSLAFEPFSYPQIRITRPITQHSYFNYSKSPHKFKIATYVCDLWSQISSIMKVMSSSTMCSFFHLCPKVRAQKKEEEKITQIITATYCSAVECTPVGPISSLVVKRSREGEGKGNNFQIWPRLLLECNSTKNPNSPNRTHLKRLPMIFRPLIWFKRSS